MAEYIEREALIEHIKDLPTWTYIAKADGAYEKAAKYPEGMFNCDDVINSVDNAPAADVVEVIRCRACKYYDIKYGVCDLHSVSSGAKVEMALKDFCSYGERRVEE